MPHVGKVEEIGISINVVKFLDRKGKLRYVVETVMEGEACKAHNELNRSGNPHIKRTKLIQALLTHCGSLACIHGG